MAGITSGYQNNNPGNLRAGPISFVGEISPVNGFRAFSSLTYGIRAWIRNLYTQVTIRGNSTYQDYLTAYAPQSDNNDANYPALVCGTDFNLTDPIALDDSSIQTLFFDQIAQEIAPDNTLISPSDFAAGLQSFKASAPGVVLETATILPSNYFILAMLAIFLAVALFAIYKIASA